MRLMIKRIDSSYNEVLDANQITDQVWCGATLVANSIPALAALGIKLVVNVEMFQNYSPESLARAGIDFLSIPIRDIDEPLADRVIDKAVAAINEFASRGEPVYTHCTAGWQRSPAIVACYLVYTGMQAEKSLALIKQKRPVARFYASHIASVIGYELRLRSQASEMRVNQ